MAILRMSIWLVLAAAAAESPIIARRPAEPVPEAQVIASFLYNMTLFVEWPSSNPPTPRVLIGVVGADDVVNALRSVEGRRVRGREIVVRALRAGDDPLECQILFLPQLGRGNQPWLVATEGQPVLTVGDDEHFIRSGGMVRLYFEQSRLRFDINVKRAASAQLRISSKVLGLARTTGTD